jgi:predicted metal-binding protein
MFRSALLDGIDAFDAVAVPADKARLATISTRVNCRGVDAESSCAGGELTAAPKTEFVSDRDLRVRSVQCPGTCEHPTTSAISAPSACTFVFGDLEPAGGASALARLVRAYRDAACAFVPWRKRGEALRRVPVVRLSPASWSPDGAPST